MAHIGEMVNKDKLDNYISVLLGLKYIVIGLQDFVIDRLKLKQKEIQQKCTVGGCQVNCSRKYGKSFIKWCKPCKYWKSELHTLNRYSTHWDQIKWNEIDSIDFPQSFEEMAKSFMKNFHSVRQGVLGDFSALMSLIRNATLFDVSMTDIDEILRIRNSCCAHNYSVELHGPEKNICFNVFLRFLKIPEITCTKSGKNALHCIETLRLSHGLPERILQKPEGRLALIDIRNEHHNGDMDQNMIYSDGKLQKRLQEVTDLLNKRKRYFRFYLGPSPKALKHAVIQLVFYICLTYWYFSNPATKESPNGCLSMRFKNHWNLDSLVDFNFYVENLHNQSIVSREWLTDKIYDELLTPRKGIILTAEMGYGKSSIISNIVCAEQISVWYAIRKNVLAYHFCRYDSISSTKPAYFIRNIASAIVKRYPELGNFILSDDIANEILYGLKCSEDPISCLEIAVLNPLRNKWKNYQFVIIIDALDECTSGDKNDISQLLFRQMDYFPPNIKFIFTSRHIEQVLSKFKDLTVVQLSTFSIENRNDITQYIRQTSDLTESEINLLTNVSRGNFLFMKLYLHSCKESNNCDFKNIPDSLEKIFQMNFERVFDAQSNLFQELRPVFEILCTTTKPMSEEHIFEVANISSENRRKIESMIGNELGHFLIFTDGYLSFLHKSIADFLTCRSRKHERFFVHKETGHALIGTYLLKFNFSEIDIADVVHHVAMSKKDVLQSILLQTYSQQVRKDMKLPILSYLHKAIRDFNSYDTTNLFLFMITNNIINDTNDRHMSAASIAASHGNEHALKCLLDYGADPYFKVIFSCSTDQTLLTDLVHRCKYIYFCGYNILHIASQNGHLQIVIMLVERFHDLLFLRNAMNLTAFDVAVENGHIAIAKYLLDKNKSFANLLSLHHAAQNGHLDIVKLLLQNGVKDTCLPCNDSFYWVSSSHGRQQQHKDFVYCNSTSTEYYSFYDDWYLITCDTALNAAVRNGHFKVVELLLKENTNSLKCTAFDGKTPIMTAVQYSQTAIFRHLINLNVNLTSKCTNELSSINRMHHLSASEQDRLKQECCSDGISIIHLLAVHWNYDIFELLYSHGPINFDERDKHQLTPLHYAFCQGSYEFIRIAINLNLNFNVRSINGSTIYHSSAVCKSLTLHTFMRTDSTYKLNIPDVKDKNGLSILQYGSLVSYNNDAYINNYGAFILLFLVAVESKHDISNTDKLGRTFLHYAMINGYYFSFLHLEDALPNGNITNLLRQTDAFGHTPVDMAFVSLPRQEDTGSLLLPKNCDINEIFHVTCKTDVWEVLSPHEKLILLVAQYLQDENIVHHFNITNYVLLSIRKSRLYPILILKEYAEKEFKNVFSNIPDIADLFESKGIHISKRVLTTNNSAESNGIPIHSTN